MTTLAQYAARTRDRDLLAVSTSGGAFTELARVVLAEGGVVFGAGWGKNWRVEHKWIDNEAGLAEFRGSKYVYSDISGVYVAIRGFLASKRKVIFFGLPCQTAALGNKFGDDANLILVAIFCHCAVMPKVWERYVAETERAAGSSIVSVRFRDKSTGWEHGRFSIDFADASKNMSIAPSENPYMRAFYCGLSVREPCLDCKFRENKASADVTIGDFWGVEKHVPEFADDGGVNAVIVFTEKGKHIFDKAALEKREVSLEEILDGNSCLVSSIRPDIKNRCRFLAKYERIGVSNAVDYAFRRPLWKRVLGRARRIFK